MIIDYHAHILPGMDHGCNNIEMSHKQLLLAKKAGVDVILATSHFYPHSDSIRSFLERRENSLSEMRESEMTIEESGNLVFEPDFSYEGKYPLVIPAAEVLLCEHMDKMEGLKQLRVSGTKLLMLEMPFQDWSEELIATLDRLESNIDYKILLVHIERYNKKQQKLILERGYSVQVNCSFVEKFSKRKTIKMFAKNDLIKALGSDIHKANDGYGNFNKAKKYLERLGTEV